MKFTTDFICLLKRHRTKEHEEENQRENWIVFLNNTYLREFQQQIPCAELIHPWMYSVKRYCARCCYFLVMWPIIGPTGGPWSCCRFLISFRSLEKGLAIIYPSWTNICTRFVFFFFCCKTTISHWRLTRVLKNPGSTCHMYGWLKDTILYLAFTSDLWAPNQENLNQKKKLRCPESTFFLVGGDSQGLCLYLNTFQLKNT